MIHQQLADDSKFTFQEQAIVAFIREFPESILELSAKDLASASYTSPATVVRFCKKLGFKGYPDFQLKYVKEYGKLYNQKKLSFSTSLSNLDVSEYVSSVYIDTIQETKELINKDTLNRVINLLCHTKKIDFYASDINFPSVQSACIKLNNLNIHAQAFNSLNEFYISSTNARETISFIISHSGKNQTMIDIAYKLRKRNSKTIAITSFVEKDLSLICNESFYLYYSSNDAFSALQYGLSLEYILDMIYSCLVIKRRL
ncbi:phosphosugar-binding transcriptional regulator [Enterococcus casseliflavus]|uniref:MurR/RpiR family transcriptional regulator n=1 Tax=Enterococcus casseliflavus TaxID=37734 RepID=UPI000E03176F|nr:MurR/RpiR family transcriptional regulator [Enterococcus casseliflavus]GEB27659.1 RpiR family transcriptional regulator [Enterococcus casseliflavus]STP32387.1 phosphosugar-binding transcriptional regulator [Enterococcus casseliflavus]